MSSSVLLVKKKKKKQPIENKKMAYGKVATKNFP